LRRLSSAGFSTTAIHEGDLDGTDIIQPIYQTTIFKHPNGKKIRGRDLKYSREDNPTVNLLERKMAALEGGDDCLAFSSGMAAISTAFISNVGKGDVIVTSKEIYGASLILLRNLEKFGIRVKSVMNDGLAEAIDSKTKLVFVESITNPTLKIPDIEGLIGLCREQGATFKIDNTFASPVNFKPISVGADYVIHSATKYIGGHNDATAGVLSGSSRGINAAWEWRRNLGGSLDPFAAYLVIRGLKTLKLRVEMHNKNAMEAAKYLEGHKKVTKVHYPGLESSPYNKIGRRLMSGFGGVVSFDVGSAENAMRLLAALRMTKTAPSLGGTETLITHPTSSSHKGIEERERIELGITPGLLRLSAGIEEASDIIEDLERGLDAL